MSPKEPSKKSWIDEWADENDEPLMKVDGYDDCAIGILEHIGMEAIVIYSKAKVISKLQKGMTETQALEWYSYNMLGSYMGDRTPGFLVTPADFGRF